MLQTQVDEKKKRLGEMKAAATAEGKLLQNRLDSEKATIEVRSN